MAELADAYGSGPYECTFMQVQVLLSAPNDANLNTAKVYFFGGILVAVANLQNKKV